ncbi:MAG: thermonuclease family protein [Geminicoccaceae bacterium]
MTVEQIRQWLGAFWHDVVETALWLADLIAALAGSITQDHLEGAFAMAVILLGPSLVIGLLTGFWQGLRMEWRHFRELPKVIDGDTIEIRGERIRLFAVDTPEIGQPWWTEDDEHQDAGSLAKEALEKLVKGRRLSVRVLREDQYRRSIAIVKVDGRDVGRALVTCGWAFASPGSDRYRRAQISAKRRKRGFWRGELQMPWDYRAAA